ncbi:MAG: hypothetical protein VKN33_10585 [Candidatus Sericytochromatia bacterium]|nr:hypothetical protein [Candidatus Sericytochromatia bacterium]
MQHHAIAPHRSIVLSDDETTTVRPPVVEASGESRLNPPSEYEVLALADLSPEKLKQRLNELGEEGWALIATTPSFIFRRLKKTEEKKQRPRVGFGVN